MILLSLVTDILDPLFWGPRERMLLWSERILCGSSSFGAGGAGGDGPTTAGAGGSGALTATAWGAGGGLGYNVPVSDC